MPSLRVRGEAPEWRGPRRRSGRWAALDERSAPRIAPEIQGRVRLHGIVTGFPSRPLPCGRARRGPYSRRSFRPLKRVRQVFRPLVGLTILPTARFCAAARSPFKGARPGFTLPARRPAQDRGSRGVRREVRGPAPHAAPGAEAAPDHVRPARGPELSKRFRATRQKLPQTGPRTHRAMRASGLAKKEIYERSGVGKETFRKALYGRVDERSARDLIARVLGEAAGLSEGDLRAVEEEPKTAPKKLSENFREKCLENPCVGLTTNRSRKHTHRRRQGNAELVRQASS